MLPEKLGEGAPLAFRVPSEFTIRYMYRGGNNNYLNHMTMCALIDMKIDYGAGEKFTTLKPDDQGASPQIIKINLAFKEVKGLEDHEVEMNDIAKKAIDSYEQLMNLGMNVSDMAAGKVFAEASNMLKIALDASDAKTKAKLQQIDLMLKKARIDKFSDKGTNEESVQATVFDRNDLLKIIKGGGADS